MSDECKPTDISLCPGTTSIGPAEVTRHGKYDPTKTVGGFRPGEGDTHGDRTLEVICCPDE